MNDSAEGTVVVGRYIGFGLGLVAACGLLWAAFGLETSSPAQLNVLLLITGALIGWVVGILMTPVSKSDGWSVQSEVDPRPRISFLEQHA